MQALRLTNMSLCSDDAFPNNAETFPGYSEMQGGAHGRGPAGVDGGYGWGRWLRRSHSRRGAQAVQFQPLKT